ncbi:MAG: BrnT family toxin [Phycisphaerae bacterium]|nr:BrnT family toxin [Phycisphaerae bacterium]
MRQFRWDEDKNAWLKRERGVCFEQVVVLMEQSAVLDVVENPNQEKYPGQKIAIVEIERYAYLVPYEQAGEEIDLKTIIPSRKATDKYLGGGHEETDS